MALSSDSERRDYTGEKKKCQQIRVPKIFSPLLTQDASCKYLPDLKKIPSDNELNKDIKEDGKKGRDNSGKAANRDL